MWAFKHFHLTIFLGQAEYRHFQQDNTCVHCIHSYLSTAKMDAGTIGTTLEVRDICADQSCSNYLTEANFSSKIDSWTSWLTSICIAFPKGRKTQEEAHWTGISFRINITKHCGPHRDRWALARTFSRSRINHKIFINWSQINRTLQYFAFVSFLVACTC